MKKLTSLIVMVSLLLACNTYAVSKPQPKRDRFSPIDLTQHGGLKTNAVPPHPMVQPCGYFTLTPNNSTCMFYLGGWSIDAETAYDNGTPFVVDLLHYCSVGETICTIKLYKYIASCDCYKVVQQFNVTMPLGCYEERGTMIVTLGNNCAMSTGMNVTSETCPCVMSAVPAAVASVPLG